MHGSKNDGGRKQLKSCPKQCRANFAVVQIWNNASVTKHCKVKSTPCLPLWTATSTNPHNTSKVDLAHTRNHSLSERTHVPTRPCCDVASLHTVVQPSKFAVLFWRTVQRRKHCLAGHCDAQMLNHRNIVVKKSTVEEARGMMAWAKVWRTGGGFNAKMSRARSRLCNYWRRQQSWKCCNTGFHTKQCSNKC